MKKEQLFLVFICFFLFGGCREKSEWEEIPVENQQCDCDHEAVYIGLVVRENIILFDSDKTSFEQMKELAFDQREHGSRFVYFDLKSGFAMEYSIQGAIKSEVVICNFPKPMTELNIPSTGIRVSYTGECYESCKFQSYIPENFYSDIIITSLKIQTQ